MRLLKTIGLTLLLAAGMQLCAAAEEQEAFYQVDKKHKQIKYTYEGAVISVARKKQAVEAIRVVDPKYITMRGVSIGDSAGRAVGQYGLPDAVVYAADNTTYEYFWQDDKEQPLRFALEVDKQSRVTAFILEKLKEK